VKQVGVFGIFSRAGVRRIVAERAAVIGKRHKVRKFDLGGELPEKLKLDLAVIVGGDGTILHAARYLAPLGIPAIGLNIGKFGFLAGCETGDCPDLVEAALSGRLKPVTRAMLSCRTKVSGKKAGQLTALNDIVVSASVPAQMIGVELAINGGAVATFGGDGIIISTATGSTGYSLSCGGPLVSPDRDVMILTPLAPHTLSIRPMVISSDDVVTVKVATRRSNVLVTADGQVSLEMKDGDSIEARRAPFNFGLYEGPNWSFYQVVRDKLRWGEEPKYAANRH
jgi:NAD+ kinase